MTALLLHLKAASQIIRYCSAMTLWIGTSSREWSDVRFISDISSHLHRFSPSAVSKTGPRLIYDTFPTAHASEMAAISGGKKKEALMFLGCKRASAWQKELGLELPLGALTGWNQYKETRPSTKRTNTARR